MYETTTQLANKKKDNCVIPNEPLVLVAHVPPREPSLQLQPDHLLHLWEYVNN